jgi:26S proteasome non-ATPase regulatory subunit 9
MSVIEKHIHEHFARLAEEGSTEEPATNGVHTDVAAPDFPPESTSVGPVFAKVNTVAAGSPAETAGLKPGDEIRNFGYVNYDNHNGLARVGQCVQGNEGVRASVELKWEMTNVVL